VEAKSLVTYLAKEHITLFCFDWPGCGLSEGEYVTLGWQEKNELAFIIDHLRTHRKVSALAIWGRSMGAATALMLASED